MQYTNFVDAMATPAGRAAITWDIERQADGTVILRTHALAFANQTVRFGVASTHACSGYTQNLHVAPGDGSASRWNLVDPLAPPSSYPTVALSGNVKLSPLGAPRALAASCEGGLVVREGLPWTSAAAAFTLLPAAGCPAVCNGQTLSLGQPAAGSALSYLSVAADGGVSVSEGGGLAATLVARRETVSGETGWVLSSMSGYTSGSVLSLAPCAGSAACCPEGAAGLALAPIPATGLATSHLFQLTWLDGSGDLASIPSVPAVDAQPACPSISASPVPTLSPTGSLSPSASLTGSSTGTASGTPSSSGSSGSTSSETSTVTPSPSGTPPETGTPSGSAAPTGTPTPTPTSSSPVRVAGRLIVELQAADFAPNPADLLTGYPSTWDNRATPGAVSLDNGDFTTTGPPNTQPTLIAAGPNGVPAVSFDPALDSAADFLEAGVASFPTSSIYGTSDWSVELWVMHSGWQSGAGENAVFQWGARPGTSCNR